MDAPVDRGDALRDADHLGGECETSDRPHATTSRALSPKLKGFVQAQSWFQDVTPITVLRRQPTGAGAVAAPEATPDPLADSESRQAIDD